MTYRLYCPRCGFERTVEDLDRALELEADHTDQRGAEHLVDIELVE